MDYDAIVTDLTIATDRCMALSDAPPEDDLRTFDRAVAEVRRVMFSEALADRLHADRAQRREAAEGAVVIPSFVTTLEVPDDGA
jgi:hypothetical protein